MSRSGYCDDQENWEMIRWRGAVAAAMKGKRGQVLLRELRDALDAMTDKRLIAGELVTPEGAVCVLGALGVRRAMPALADLEPTDYDAVAAEFGVAPALVQEIEDANDAESPCDPAKRWVFMRRWVDARIEETVDA